MADVPQRERRKGLAAISLVTLLWSANFVAAAPAASAFDPVALTFVRAAAAAAVFVPAVLAAGGRRHLTRANLLAALPLALACVAGNQVLFLLASRNTSPTHVAVVIATIPVFVALLARLVGGEALAPRRVAGIAVAFAGVVLLALQREHGGSAPVSLRGDLYALVAALAFALFTVGNKGLVARTGALAATALVYAAAALLLLPPALPALLRGSLAGSSRAELLSAAYLVGGATLVAYPLFAYALGRLTASRVAVFTYLQPLLAAVLSYRLGWERFPPGTVLGAVLTVTGVALAQKRAPGR